MSDKIKLTEEQAKAIYKEQEIDSVSDYEIVEELEWKDDGKYDNGGLVFKRISDGKNFLLIMSRCGSYHTDYHFNYYLDCPEVTKKTKTIEYWGEI